MLVWAYLRFVFTHTGRPFHQTGQSSRNRMCRAFLNSMCCGRGRIPEQEYPSFNKREDCTEEQSHSLNQPGIFSTFPENGLFGPGDDNDDHRTDMNLAPVLTPTPHVGNQETSRPPTRRRHAVLEGQASTILAETSEAQNNEHADERLGPSEIPYWPTSYPWTGSLMRSPLDISILPAMPLP
jgi:hypothetical protein